MKRNLGTRILVWGHSCSGKTTLAGQLAEVLDLRKVDLDALNWLPDWVGLNDVDPERLQQRMIEATAGDRWIVSGSYTRHSQATFWPRLETIIWLDMPLGLLLRQMLGRSWRRWRDQELLWGTNREDFWGHFRPWGGNDSLLWWIVTQHHRKRYQAQACMADPKWQHIGWMHLRNEAEVQALIDAELARPGC